MIYAIKCCKKSFTSTTGPVQFGKTAQPHRYWKSGDHYEAWCGGTGFNGMDSSYNLNDAHRKLKNWGDYADVNYVVDVVVEYGLKCTE